MQQNRLSSLSWGCVFIALMAAMSICVSFGYVAVMFDGRIPLMTKQSSLRSTSTAEKETNVLLKELGASFGCAGEDEKTVLTCVQRMAAREKSHENETTVLLKDLGASFGCAGEDQKTVLACAQQRAREKSQADRVIKEDMIQQARKRAALSIEQLYGKPSTPQGNANNNEPALDSTFAPLEKWKNTTFADIEIVGFPKAGTSQLYKVLSSRPDTRQFHPQRKEFCMGPVPPNKSLQQWLFEWHQQVHDSLAIQTSSSSHRTTTVNACINMQDVIVRYQYLKPPSRKFIILFRDPADWLWAAFNFWTIAGLDVIENAPNRWTIQEQNYRSPELFHEIIAAGSKTRFRERFDGFRSLSVRGPRSIAALAGMENVLMLRGEDMRPSVVNKAGGFLDKLSNFTGLDRSLYGKEIFSITNCNNQKGERANCGNSSTSSYEIAGNRDMLPETRDLIYLFFWEECKIWAQEFGVVYPDCLNVIR